MQQNGILRVDGAEEEEEGTAHKEDGITSDPEQTSKKPPVQQGKALLLNGSGKLFARKQASTIAKNNEGAVSQAKLRLCLTSCDLQGCRMCLKKFSPTLSCGQTANCIRSSVQLRYWARM